MCRRRRFIEPVCDAKRCRRLCAGDLQHQASQLIERVNNLHAHQNERCDHEIKSKMHEGLAPKNLAALAVLRRTGNQTQYSLMMTALTLSCVSIRRQ
jgi:hypothetical protein